MNQPWLCILFACLASRGVKSSSNDPAYHRTVLDVERGSGRNWTTLSDALDIFDVRHLASNWTEGKYPVEEQCSKDVTRYIEGLMRSEVWALKGTSTFKVARRAHLIQTHLPARADIRYSCK